MTKNIDKIREKLGQLVSSQNAENWWKPDLFEKNTRSQLPKEIEVVASPPVSEENYNCFVYALGLEKDPKFFGDDAWKRVRFLDRTFEVLINKGLLDRTDSPESGGLVVYRSKDGTINHVGIVRDDGRVISKWSLGPLLVHDIWVVPDHYGNNVSFWKIKEGAVDFVKDLFYNKKNLTP